MEYSVDKRFKKRLSKKPMERQAGVLKCIAQVAEDARGTSGLHSKKIGTRDGHDVFYSRISSGDRLTFHYEGDTIVFRNHCFKQDVLRSP